MSSAPTLSKPPRLQPKSDSFASPGFTPDKPPTTGTNAPLAQAAMASSAGSTALQQAQRPRAPRAPRTPRPTGGGSILGAGTDPFTQAAGASAQGAQALRHPKPKPVPKAAPPPAPGPKTIPPGTGAPPGVPDTTIPLLPQDEQAIQYAQQDYSNTADAANYGMGQAASAYGDPTQMARFGVGQINPNSALAMAALRAQQQTEATTNEAGRNNTLFSSLALENQGRIGATQQRADLAGNMRYQSALAKFNAAMVNAASVRDRAIDAAHADERAAALKNLPTANTATGGFPSTTATGSKSIATGGGKGQAPAKGSKGGTKPGKVNVPKSKGAKGGKGKGVGTVKKPGTIKPSKPPKVGKR